MFIMPVGPVYSPMVKAAALAALGPNGAWLLLSMDHYLWRARYDLAQALIQLETGDHDWAELTGHLLEMQETFARVARGEIMFSKSLNTKWRDLCRRLSTGIAARSVPFPRSDEEKGP